MKYLNTVSKTAAKLSALCVLASAAAAPSFASDDNYEYSGFTTGLGTGVYFYEGDEEFNSALIVNANVGYDLSNRFTLEGNVGYLPSLQADSSTDGSSRKWHLDDSAGIRSALDLIYHLDENPGRVWDPNLGATAGVMYYENTQANGQHFDPFGGIGAGLGYALNRNWVARGDYRLMAVGHDTQINHQTLVSLAYRWGSSASGSAFGDGEDDPELAAHRANLKPVYFDFDKSAITADGAERLKHNAKYLQDNADLKVTVEGHCDERGTTEYNYALGERRAVSAKKYLNTLGVGAERLDTNSFGEDQPAEAGSNEAAWAKNRRAICNPRR